MSNLILFQTAEGSLCEETIRNSFQSCGICQGDILLVHSRLFTLGRLADVTDKNDLTRIFIQIFLDTVGPDGTLIFPTFTFDFCKTGVFDLTGSPSEMGILSEAARLWPDSIRTHHPIYSFAIIGHDKQQFLAADNTTCFGKHSFFELLHNMNLKTHLVKFITLGVDYPPSVVTYIHYLEEKAGVPYRYHKKFQGEFIRDGRNHYVETEFYVRDLSQNVVFDEQACWQLWTDSMIATSIPLGDSIICSVNEHDLHDVTLNAIKAKNDFLCVGDYQNNLN